LLVELTEDRGGVLVNELLKFLHVHFAPKIVSFLIKVLEQNDCIPPNTKVLL
jgi:hypothetical protein